MISQRIKLSELVAPFLLVFAIFFLFLKAPGLGDDFQYWRIGWAIHERGLAGWSSSDFHDLRWPVWGLCWVLQGLFGPGLASYYGVPLFYLLLATGLVYTLAKRYFQSGGAAFASTVIFLCNPLLDPVIHRPMPDLPEGTLIGLAVLTWIALVETEKKWGRFLWALATGVIAAVLFANRITGVFVFGVLVPVAGVMAWKNERFSIKQTLLWLAVVGAVFLCLVSIEGLIYKQITGDFFHSITANLGAKGKKGTDSIPLYKFPFRFLGVLWKSGHLGPFYFIASVIGIIPLWRHQGRIGRAIVVWGIALYLAYSCSLQSLFPPRPLLRDADRFLCSLALPFSIMAAAGSLFVLQNLRRVEKLAFLRSEKLDGKPALVCFAVALIALLCIEGRRSFFERGYIPELSLYLDKLPAGTRIFTHHAMRSAAFLANGEKAKEMVWYAPHSIFNYKEAHEREAAKADEFWYCRKISWIGTRQAIESDAVQQKNLGSYFIDPDKEWSLQRAIQVGGVPEFVLYTRRGANDPQPTELTLKDFVPSASELPLQWERPESVRKGRVINEKYKIPIPETLRGKAVRVRLTAQANFVQSVRLSLFFYEEKKRIGQLDFRPYFHSKAGVDFHTFEIPEGATRCEAKVSYAPKAQNITINEFSFLLSPVKQR